MEDSLINYVLAFTEGFALILSPCILPILPIILSGGMTGGKRRPLGIIIGFTLFFAVLSLVSSELVRDLGAHFDWIRKIAYGLIIVFGVILFSDYLSGLFSTLTQRWADKGLSYSEKETHSGLWSGIVFGGLVSLVWLPCGGPILAAAIISMAVQKTQIASFFSFLCFAFGSVIPMVLIALMGKKIIQKTQFLKAHLHLIRKIFGLIIIVFALLTGFFNPLTFLTKTPIHNNVASDKGLIHPVSSPYKAPDFPIQMEWLNSPPLTLKALQGKVVLIDFWTYSCINCLRTLPYVKDWYHKYHDKGLVIIGVHTPEFSFEKDISNVKDAIKRYQIPYPVVLDNNYAIWQRYNNSYWPAHYLIDQQGRVIYTHFGEGDYDITEHNIQLLLGISGETAALISSNKTVSDVDTTPETYLGTDREEAYNGTPNLSATTTPQQYTFPSTLDLNQWALQGSWQINSQHIVTMEKNAAIKIHFKANHVYMVMGTEDNQPVKATVLLNHQLLTSQDNATSFTVSEHRLYTVVNLPKTEEGELEVRFSKPGVKLYTFTFG